ncbi:Clp protease N-terminal domain-containing protein [Nocardia sp. NPDC005978]|uniref:Clp protease N-terminal domain-containing protein n=1 Tax=unclassified Nocardia TaxID=2637762 RepID=UPI0033AC27B5
MFERFARAAKFTVVGAQEEARELRSPVIDVQHLFLGLLAAPDAGLHELLAAHGHTAESVRAALTRTRAGEPLGEQDAEALRSIGIDLDAVRESLAETFGADALERAVPAEEPRRGLFRGKGPGFGHIPFTREAKKILELALREAVARKDDRIEAGHILLAILRAPNPATRELLGADLEPLRADVAAHLDRAA